MASFINTNFEAAWETVRPVPIIRIDFGDGHVATRTLHGNIATYVCAADRQVVDILPGIYTPLGYVAALGALCDLPATLGQNWERQLPTYHRERAQFLRSQPARIVYARGALEPPAAALTSAVEVARPTARQINTPPVAAGNFQRGFGGGGGFASEPRGPARAGSALSGGEAQARSFAGGGFKGGIEWRTEQIVSQAPGNAGNISAPGPRPRPGSDLADWQPLAVDTWYNETQRRLLIHDRLALGASVRPDQIKRWVYKAVLHADLDDPYLGLGDALFGDDVFAEDE